MNGLPTITDLSHADGYWTATVTVRGVRVHVDRKWGSWMQLHDKPALVKGGGSSTVQVRREVPRLVAEALQARVRPIERRQRGAAA